jgi:hypothetical protein
MMTITRIGDRYRLTGEVRGIAVYLDNFAIIRIAQGPQNRRDRFLKCLSDGSADLLFSVANTIDLVGSNKKVKGFLKQIANHWFPVDLSVNDVCKREEQGLTGADTFSAMDFAQMVFAAQVQPNLASGEITHISPDLFAPDKFIEWLELHKDRIRKDRSALDETLFRRVKEYRSHQKLDSSWVEDSFPEFVRFRRDKPAMFAYENIIRGFVIDRGTQPKKGDGLDLSHAVLGSAFASFAALDGQWKKRIESLPKPNGLAKIYSEHELDQMVPDIEGECKKIRKLRARGLLGGAVFVG